MNLLHTHDLPQTIRPLAVAEFLGRGAAILLSTGYMTNLVAVAGDPSYLTYRNGFLHAYPGSIQGLEGVARALRARAGAELGQVAARFHQESDTATVWAGFSHGLVGRRSARWSAGYSFDRERFDPAPGETPPDPFPTDRTLSFPWVGYDSVQDGFITVQDLDKIKRTEDLNLAREGHARLGWAAPAFGSDRGRMLFEGCEIRLHGRKLDFQFVQTGYFLKDLIFDFRYQLLGGSDLLVDRLVLFLGGDPLQDWIEAEAEVTTSAGSGFF